MHTPKRTEISEDNKQCSNDAVDIFSGCLSPISFEEIPTVPQLFDVEIASKPNKINYYPGKLKAFLDSPKGQEIICLVDDDDVLEDEHSFDFQTLPCNSSQCVFYSTGTTQSPKGIHDCMLEHLLAASKQTECHNKVLSEKRLKRLIL